MNLAWAQECVFCLYRSFLKIQSIIRIQEVLTFTAGNI